MEQTMTNQSFIKITDLHKIYQMGETEVHALAGISLTIERGTFTVIMGPSGSGKSTLLYLLGGLDLPTSGSMVVDGLSIERMDENALAQYRRTKVGFIFQAFNLVGTMTAMENVSFPMRFGGVKPAMRKEKSAAMLKQVGLADRTHHRPVELSGGQQQRVAIARALINDPVLILADEPTGNLDSASGYTIMQLMSDLQKSGKTILVATHDPRMLSFATHIIYLLDGKDVPEETYKQAIQVPA